MLESIKSVLALCVLAGPLAAMVAWFATEDPPSYTTLGFRIGAPLFTLASVAMLLYLHFKKDKVPDFLSKKARTFFENDGFCFTLVPTVKDAVCEIQVIFQNRYSKSSNAQIVIQPSIGYFVTRDNADCISININCEPAAYGIAYVPLSVPAKHQGTTQTFDVGAAVEYPEGRGSLLRFRDGLPVGAANFDSTKKQILTVAAALGGAIYLSKPASCSLRLPENVTEEVDGAAPIRVDTIWKLGDPVTAVPVD